MKAIKDLLHIVQMLIRIRRAWKESR